MPHNHHAPSFEQALGALKAAKLKRTRPRELLLKYLVSHHGPFSAKDLHQALQRRELDAVTTYRSLAAFEEAGIVRRCDFGDGIARFEFHDVHHHHHHVVCVDCGKVEMLDDCELKPLEDKVKELGYSNVRHTLEFRGLCKNCSTRRAN
ncbi:MAG: Fur family transcriptional regulator [Bdellovibrionota bacterium]